MRHPSYIRAEEFDRKLGDPYADDTPFSFAGCLALDEREEFPEEICRLLDDLGVPAEYVPAVHGGALRGYEDLLHRVRLLARRDLTVAIAHGKTYLGAVSAWVAADDEQAGALGAQIASGAVVCWGLSEREHGSDLLAGEVTAVRDGDRYVISGEKWPINNATRSDLVCLLARTAPGGGPRGFSLLLVDKRRIAGAFHSLPKARTSGVRGADISGVCFTGAKVPANAVLGAPGAGLEIVLKSLQLTRTLCAALSLGPADHALRLALDFASAHRMYGRVLLDLPEVGRRLTEVYADLLVAEVVGLLAVRSIHALPAELSVISAVVKYLVPTTVDRMLDELGQVLGARAYLTGRELGGGFQKIVRDHRIVGIFDGSTVVNLNAVINQFPVLARAYRAGKRAGAGLAATTSLRDPLPAFDPSSLRLAVQDGVGLVQALPEAIEELTSLAGLGSVSPALLATARALWAETEDVHEAMAAYRPSARDVPASAFVTAERYALCFAGAACLLAWLRNRADAPPDDPLWTDGRWVHACLARVVELLGGEPGAEPVGTLAPALLAQYRDGRLFSPWRCRLAGERRA
ncbi:acyl-CoA dehydrogenase [Amycolatopsis samaneae]|uniref:Acyl-CoA dehydrogenase n=1 Tax=Amycolatopsis samaneae TaxID=664691 RepID=A0ABW5GP43_9PSEU